MLQSQPLSVHQGVKRIIKCYDKLTAIETEVSLYELDHRLTTIEHIRNRDRMYDEISDEIDSTENLNLQKKNLHRLEQQGCST